MIDVERLAARLGGCRTSRRCATIWPSSHSSPEQVGEIATQADVGTLVLTHLVPGDFEVPEEEWEARVRPHFDGEVLCGVDLDEFALPSG